MFQETALELIELVTDDAGSHSVNAMVAAMRADSIFKQITSGRNSLSHVPCPPGDSLVSEQLWALFQKPTIHRANGHLNAHAVTKQLNQARMVQTQLQLNNILLAF
ncbi:unnamed protein product [Polarella glacialis]|uniref:Uncharacterized protein n=1 Tax=Polarella glacialis TaxID=89957 RepID=A0A813ID50_POLGL|nr:unnamed protein product [Polarella glacialis]